MAIVGSDFGASRWGVRLRRIVADGCDPLPSGNDDAGGDRRHRTAVV